MVDLRDAKGVSVQGLRRIPLKPDHLHSRFDPVTYSFEPHAGIVDSGYFQEKPPQINLKNSASIVVISNQPTSVIKRFFNEIYLDRSAIMTIFSDGSIRFEFPTSRTAGTGKKYWETVDLENSSAPFPEYESRELISTSIATSELIEVIVPDASDSAVSALPEILKRVQAASAPIGLREPLRPSHIQGSVPSGHKYLFHGPEELFQVEDVRRTLTQASDRAHSFS